MKYTHDTHNNPLPRWPALHKASLHTLGGTRTLLLLLLLLNAVRVSTAAAADACAARAWPCAQLALPPALADYTARHSALAACRAGCCRGTLSPVRSA
jgi:hypothetical protein